VTKKRRRGRKPGIGDLVAGIVAAFFLRERVYVASRSREDYERGIKCAHCPNVIRLGDEVDGMTCIDCGAEVCRACMARHEETCR
jgi:hypothetical protein